MYVADVLYRKCVPGLNGTGWPRKVLVQTSSGLRAGSVCWPVDMRSKSVSRIAFRLALGSFGASSGKNLSTGSSIDSLPSATAKPTAVEVKLFESEKSMCRAWGEYGAHQPSATTLPWRTSMKLWSESTSLSAASMKARTADERTSWASGVLRGSGWPANSPAGTSRVAKRERDLTASDLRWGAGSG